MKLYKNIALLIILSCISVSTFAQTKDMFEHKLIAGFNFGATAPVPIPREVRSITSYWPQFTPQLGYSFIYNYTDIWSIKTGITLDYKGMGVQDKVKYMYTDVVMDGNPIKGYFTGRNETTVKTSYITVPLNVGYSFGEKWKVNAGGYFSYRTSAEFTGTVWDGYLRRTDNKDIINSEYIEIDDKNAATFDFGSDMRKYDVGVNLGLEYQFNEKIGMYTDFTYGLIPVFPSKFTGIDMKMRNIYLAVGLSYRLK